MICIPYVTYAMIVRFPDCEDALSLIWTQVKEVILIDLFFLAIITALNFLFERKLEKKNTRVFLFLLVFHSIILAVALLYFSNDFYSHCGEET